MYFLAILTLMYFFYVILFHEDVFLNFLNRQCIYSMLFEFTKIYFNLPFSTANEVFLLSQPLMFSCMPSIHKYIFSTSKPSPFTPWGVMLTRFAMLGMIAWPTLPPGPLECEGSEWNHPHSVYLRFVNERTMVKCKLHQ